MAAAGQAAGRFLVLFVFCFIEGGGVSSSSVSLPRVSASRISSASLFFLSKCVRRFQGVRLCQLILRSIGRKTTSRYSDVRRVDIRSCKCVSPVDGQSRVAGASGEQLCQLFLRVSLAKVSAALPRRQLLSFPPLSRRR